MAWSENIHIHVHCDCQKTLLEILAELKKLTGSGADVVPQEIMDKLDSVIADIKSTV